MTINMMRAVLGWCSIINLGLLFWWFLVLMFAHDLIYRMHSKWFNLSVERFDAIHYSGITFFKIVVFVFNVVPYFVLHLVA